MSPTSYFRLLTSRSDSRSSLVLLALTQLSFERPVHDFLRFVHSCQQSSPKYLLLLRLDFVVAKAAVEIRADLFEELAELAARMGLPLLKVGADVDDDLLDNVPVDVLATSKPCFDHLLTPVVRAIACSSLASSRASELGVLNLPLSRAHWA